MQYRQQKAEQDLAASDRDLETRKTEAGINKIDNDILRSGDYTLSEGQARYENGQMVASRAKTYAPNTGGSGVFSNMTEAVQTLESSRGKQYTNENGETINPTGADADFANTGVYLSLMEQATSQGEPVTDFFKDFPPKDYLNPKDASVPAHVKARMKAYDPVAQYVAEAIAQSGIITQPTQ